jgi:predicted nuclease of predicted toxin-antitoxin system
MKFLIDANLPERMIDWIVAAGHDAVHVISLPNQDRSTDIEIAMWAETESCVIITKDQDFITQFLRGHSPSKRVWIRLGNVNNRQLRALIAANIHAIVDALANHDVIEFGYSGLIIHPPQET